MHGSKSKEIFGGAKVFAPVSQNCPKNFGQFLCKYFLMKTFFGSPPKMGLHVILPTLGAIFSRIFGDFAKVLTDFVQISTEFARIF